MARWTEGVTIVRAGDQERARSDGAGRATVFRFTGSGGQETWIGTVSLPPGAKTGAHHHGRHEVAVHVAKGRGRICWGDRLEFAADIGPGDFVYFAPHVPHQEVNLDAGRTLDFVVVRSDDERISVPIDQPEMLA